MAQHGEIAGEAGNQHCHPLLLCSKQKMTFTGRSSSANTWKKMNLSEDFAGIGENIIQTRGFTRFLYKLVDALIDRSIANLTLSAYGPGDGWKA